MPPLFKLRPTDVYRGKAMAYSSPYYTVVLNMTFILPMGEQNVVADEAAGQHISYSERLGSAAFGGSSPPHIAPLVVALVEIPSARSAR